MFTVSGRVFAILPISNLIIVEYVELKLEITTQEFATVNQVQVSTWSITFAVYKQKYEFKTNVKIGLKHFTNIPENTYLFRRIKKWFCEEINKLYL